MPRGYLLSTTLNRPRRADVRTRTAVGAKVRINPGPFFSGRNSLEGTDLQAFSAVGAALSNPVSHMFNVEFGVRSAEFLTGITGLDFYSAFRIPNLKVLPHILIRIDFFFLGVNAHGIHFHIPAITQIA